MLLRQRPPCRPMTSPDIFIARQPIFDRQLEVFGYELLARGSRENVYTHGDGDEASAELINACLNVFHFDSLTNHKKAFINATSGLLSEDLRQVLPVERTVVEVLETVEPGPEVLSAVRELKEAGYLIALDDFCYHPRFDPLVALADIIKIDFLETQGRQRREVFELLSAGGKLMLAEKVETQADLSEAMDIGYALFQGFFFCKPEMFERKDLPRFKLNYLRFLSTLAEPDLEFERVEEAVKHEPSLSVRLLRYLNSAAFGMRSEVTSIRQALVHMGETPLRRWGATVALVGLGEDKPSELAATTLIRARFCELLGQAHGDETSSEFPFFMAGLFSTLDAMLDLPLEDALDQLALAPETRGAILGEAGREGDLLKLIVAFEHADWPDVSERAAQLGVNVHTLSELYDQAVRWAEDIHRESDEEDA